jgi:hypothetical protein
MLALSSELYYYTYGDGTQCLTDPGQKQGDGSFLYGINGIPLSVEDCSTEEEGFLKQKWVRPVQTDYPNSSIYQLRSAYNSSKCIDLGKGDTTAKNALQIWDCAT